MFTYNYRYLIIHYIIENMRRVYLPYSIQILPIVTLIMYQ